MNLPEFLSDDHGEIYLAGHRIALHHLLYFYNQGFTAEMLALQFPTLALSQIHKTIAFYLEHVEEVNAYLADHAREMATLKAKSGTGPSMSELQKRFEARQQARAS